MAATNGNSKSGESSSTTRRGRAKAATKTATTRSSRRRNKTDEATVDLSDDPVVEQANEHDLDVLKAAQRAKLIKFGILAAIAIVLITFVIQNADPVNLQILFMTVTVRLIWVIVGAVALGALAGFLLGSPPKSLRFHGPKRRKGDG